MFFTPSTGTLYIVLYVVHDTEIAVVAIFILIQSYTDTNEIP
jgi:hypothetical protein